MYFKAEGLADDDDDNTDNHDDCNDTNDDYDNQQHRIYIHIHDSWTRVR